jgi:hypothetical protein
MKSKGLRLAAVRAGLLDATAQTIAEIEAREVRLAPQDG